MADYDVTLLDQEHFEEWDSFVQSSPQGTLFSTSGWLVASGQDFSIYGVMQKGRLVAGIPVAHRKLPMGVLSAEHPPLSPYLGVLHEPGEAKYVKRITKEKEIHRAVAAKLKQDFGNVRFNFHPGETDLQPFVWEGYKSEVRYTYRMPLDDLTRIWDDMEKRRRNDIHRAERDGVSVEKTTHFEGFFSLVEKTFERQQMHAGFRESALRYNELLSRTGQSQIFIAKDADGSPIAGVYLVWDQHRAYYLLGGYDPEKGHTGASAIAMWEAIQFASNELNLTEFDFEGSMIPAVEQFFRKFGGTLTPYYSVSWSTPIFDLVLQLRASAKRILRGGR
jgi:hypothetical protein